ncbi:hypothetical protein JQN72_02145 [Phycicoccus sp. CSK15P-2]|uniref:glycoside hydrolase family 2 protein n=1 Tax=Phycicoccus sp. CSK15P-2 TaxID=2807627 RepID=UPI001950F1A3|nr:hypothetical protein [Phycicoccus sp. CSK15P-2]MBM6403050.1 hypothetical protein [Phycicoccus sp. CSK15P-2]
MNLTAWDLRDVPVGTGDPTTLSADAEGDWIRAVVPGGVHESLISAGRLVDPLSANGIDAARWVEHRDWWYRSRFVAPDAGCGGAVVLVADRLDTVAELWLDGEPIGGHRNQFRPAQFDLTDRLGDPGDEHVLLVRFSPPLPPGDAGLDDGLWGAARHAAAVRKASFSWGWDFAPRLPSVGIAGPVRLEVRRVARIVGHHAATSFLASDHSHADVLLQADVEGVDASSPHVVFTLTTPGGRVHRTEVPVVEGVASATVGIPDPELWWTHDLGVPALHRLDIELRDADRALDRLEAGVGVRTITLDRSHEPVEGGRLFRFVLNGVPMFVRGANWVPPSPLVGAPDEPMRRELVLRAREGGMSMLRVWGGGIYEHEAFYDACDELGILVWQDFMFACVAYPGDDPAFVAEVEAEARHQVRRLRGRACLALWCGNNEVEALELIARANGSPAREWGERIFHDLLPAVVAEVDPSTAYWPGSPWGEPADVEVNGVCDGDRHDWEVWHGNTLAPYFTGSDRSYPTDGDRRHWRRYADDTGRFVSEFGILAAPERATLDRWMPGAELHDEMFDAHLTDRPKTKVEELLAVTTGLPADLDEYVSLTQAVQAEALQFACEHFRRRQPLTAGALVWQLNDCWPAVSWSMLDVDGVPKAAYYAFSRAAAPLVVSLRAADDEGVELWLVNNTRARRTVDLDVELGTFDGVDRRTERVSAQADPGESRVVWTGHVAHDARHYAWASSPAGAFPSARLHFAQLGALELGASRLDVVAGDGRLDITSHGYSYGVRISQPAPGMRLSDNHFDLRDGECRRVRVTGVDPESLTVAATIPRARAGLRRTT